jgi:hypothetical protein
MIILVIRLVFLAFFFRIFTFFALSHFSGIRDPRQTLQLFSFSLTVFVVFMCL